MIALICLHLLGCLLSEYPRRKAASLTVLHMTPSKWKRRCWYMITHFFQLVIPFNSSIIYRMTHAREECTALGKDDTEEETAQVAVKK